MRLTAYTDYTLRTLMYLAVHDGRPATIGAIAASYRVSEAHLMKVVHQLGTAGDVETIRGRNGGVRLARAATEINLGTVVRRTEAESGLVPCFEDPHTCVIGEICVLRAVLNEALAAFTAVLDRYTVADIVSPRNRLTALLGIEHHAN